jgi:hypothetical protein
MKLVLGNKRNKFTYLETDMIKIDFETHSDLLKKTFRDTKNFESMDDWNLFNLALFHGRAVIIKTEHIKKPHS